MSARSYLARTLIAAAIVGGTSAAHAAPSSLQPERLRVEYRENPLGLGVTQPRFSFVPVAADKDARGLRQSAYQILVASSPEKLKGEQGDLWDTGKVASDETIQLVYGGKPLASGQQAWWAVRVWDGPGNASDWSKPATFSAGLLKPEDWKAKWIGYDAPAPKHPDHHAAKDVALTLDGLKWVWSTPGGPNDEKPKGRAYFRKIVELPAGAKVKKAMLVGTVDDKMEIQVNGQPAGGGGDFRRVHTFDLTKPFVAGKNVVAIVGENGAGPAGLIGRLKLELEQGEPVVVPIDASWKSTNEEPKGAWAQADFDDAAWKPASELGNVGVAPWGTPGQTVLELPPPPYLRKAFAAKKDVKRATVYASALGLYELSINGRRVGEDYFRPGWTDYNDRVYYQTYDVTDHVKKGDNAIGALLGDGWYAGYYNYQNRRHLYGSEPRLIAQLVVEYADGSTDTVVTDESWKASYGPVLEADLLMGSAYDARLAIKDWDQPGFDDSKWQPVAVSPAPKAKLLAQVGVPVTRHEEIKAREITEPSKGVYVFDLGQNLVGWVRLKVKSKPGQRITLRHAEMLNPDGTLYLTALRGARAMDTYYPATDGAETWEPPFTFHGFRYVEVSGLTEKPDLDAVTGVVVHSDIERTGHFECSNELVNQLFHNIIWGQKGNYFEAPFDCPQRDERLGWTGDAQFFIRTGTFNFDVAAFFDKWLIDLIQDAQHPNGAFADVAPDLLGGAGNTAWGDAGVICPYWIYKVYGDTRLIEQNYANMAKYMDFLQSTSKRGVRGQGAYGDWVNLGGGAKSEVIGTAYFAYVSRLMADMASAIGKAQDARKYSDWSDVAEHAFQSQFLNPDGSIKESSQTGYALAFTMGLLPDKLRAASAERFVEEIKKKDWHLATGFIGTPRLLPGLTAAGRSDVAYKLLLTETFPSWLYQVKLGATTMWERWDGWTPEKGFQDPGMNSFNHYAFGSVGQWLYGAVAGIETDGVAFKSINIRPIPGHGLTHATARYQSPRGEVVSGWKLDGDGKLTLDVTVPPNTTATVYVPAKDAATVTEGGKPAKESKGVEFVRHEDGAVVYKVGSGRYTFGASQ